MGEMKKKQSHGIKNKLKLIRTDLLTPVVTKSVVRKGKCVLRELDYNSRHAVEVTEKLLFRILEDNKDTEYGKKYDFANIHSIEEYRQKVPFSTYDDYAPFIERMVHQNEKNLLTAEEPHHYALSSGSVGVPKYIPVLQEELDIYSKYGANYAFAVMDEYYRNTTGKSLQSGIGLNTVELKLMETEHGVPKGAISATLLKPLKPIMPYFMSSPWDIICPQEEMNMKYMKLRFALPRTDISFMNAAFMTAIVDLMDYLKDNWQMLCQDIAEGIIHPEIKISESLRSRMEEELQPDPVRAKRLTEEFEKGFDTPIIPRIWPGVSWIGGIGTGGFFTYAKRMRAYTGRNIPFHNLVYAASESLMAAARHPGDTSYVLVPNGGFYEFIPIKNENEETLTIDQLEEGEEYEIVITNLSGFYRYRIKDVIRVTGFYNEAPLIEFIYRRNQMLSIAGEKTNEEAVRWSIEQFMKETGVRVNDYSVFADENTKPGHYVVLIEPETIIPKDQIEGYRQVIEQKLMQANPSFGDKIRTNVLGQTELVLLQQQTYQLYREVMMMKGVSPNQLKPVRVIDTPLKERFFFGLKEIY